MTIRKNTVNTHQLYVSTYARCYIKLTGRMHIFSDEVFYNQRNLENEHRKRRKFEVQKYAQRSILTLKD